MREHTESTQRVELAELVEVRFDGDQLQTMRRDETVYVVVKRVCEALGIDHDSQRKRLSDVDRAPWACTVIMTARDTSSRMQEMFCVDLDSLPMWLATIDVGRVRPEARAKLIAYQRECARVLRDHFFGRAANAPPISADTLAAITAIGDELARAREERDVLSRQIDRMLVQTAWMLQHAPHGGRIAPADLRELKRRVGVVCDLMVSADMYPTENCAQAFIYANLRAECAWGGSGKPWRMLPSKKASAAFGVLERLRRTVEKSLAARKRQMDLEGLLN